MLNNIAIIGQGYVGLPLAITAAEAGFNVVGVDVDLKKINALNNGSSTTEDIANSRLRQQLREGRYCATSDFKQIVNATIIIICVPTPLSPGRKPDLTHLDFAVDQIARNLTPGSLVILESTVEPGTTRNIVLPALATKSGIDIGKIDLAFSPERIDPTNTKWNLVTTPKVVSGVTTSAKNRAVAFYSKFVNNLVECDSPEIAETAKLLENSFRLVNISLINEVSVFCEKLGIDISAVISTAATKPYGFMPFYPSVGVGGHCIPVDPIYLANKARKIGAQTKLIELADKVNSEMPDYFVGRAEQKLGKLKGKKVLVVGVSYKPNISDVRETPVKALVAGLNQKGAYVSWHDDLVKEWNGEKSAALGSGYDLAIIATPHDYLDLAKLGDVPILNTRGSI